MFDPQFASQTELLLRCLPEVAKQSCFALKGGTAINLFVRDMPRLSVDIDLTYLPQRERAAALTEIDSALGNIADAIESSVDGSSATLQKSGGKALRILVTASDTQIKVEPNLVLRGTVYPCVQRDLCVAARDHFRTFVTMNCLSMGDLYAGKICAALDRQHPRDLFDVMLLLDDEGLTADIRRALVVYLAGHSRPMNELLAPKFKDFEDEFAQRLAGMQRTDVTLERLRAIQKQLPQLVRESLSEEEKRFLLSMKEGEPAWDLLGIDHLRDLPALQWKLINVRKMSASKHATALTRLRDVLDM